MVSKIKKSKWSSKAELLSYAACSDKIYDWNVEIVVINSHRKLSFVHLVPLETQSLAPSTNVHLIYETFLERKELLSWIRIFEGIRKKRWYNHNCVALTALLFVATNILMATSLVSCFGNWWELEVPFDSPASALNLYLKPAPLVVPHREERYRFPESTNRVAMFKQPNNNIQIRRRFGR